MKIEDIVKESQTEEIVGGENIEATSLTMDSRSVEKGAMFFAVKGMKVDGHKYIESAIDRGAVAVVCQEMPEKQKSGVTYIKVENVTREMGKMASAFYGNPSSKLKLIGVTGTNGKTTTATLLYKLFKELGYKAGLISTVSNIVDEDVTPAKLTTPDAITTNSLLSDMVDAGCDFCFMEVSSHSVVQERISGLRFAGGVFTNLSHDHLDYHKTFAEYVKAKQRFFDSLPTDAFVLTNVDDKNGQIVVQNTKAEVKSYSLKSFSDFKCKILEVLFDGMLLNIEGCEVWVGFIGRFNAYNLLAVYGTALLLGVESAEVLRIMSALKPVDGRFEHLRSSKGIIAIVDYAHTPDALDNVLDTINEIRTPQQKLYTLVGCGGDRDAEKRPKMANIAATKSDLAILTSDNPRTEDPVEIIEQMKKGIDIDNKYIAITDRRQAIKTAVIMASPGDIILVAGKGHETYQEIDGIRSHFDDKEEILEAFEGIA